MEGKKVRESQVVLAQQMNPQDANPAGNVHGGVIMKMIDTAAGVAAIRHSRSNAVTASVDRLDFYHPVFVGNLLSLRASVNFVGKTSMEVGVRVESENLLTGERLHTSTAYLTYVALDDQGRPLRLPPLILETETQKRRHQEAQTRRRMRLAEKTHEKSCQRDQEV
ncbi:MAG TPA: acyl-CoA thioesterase [Syntrophales bacterium]|nr:acyl-CoA thioesterase [Syntrophales bacterium]HPN07851.1 acyl-CoA thioesterase [Syntrophales bacterium]HQB12886.1 acyl-CoA thioesterase [Syntrophales bacterium]HQK78495.1 acyl-CoA thioesterase [Syntrophales bacterium]